MEMKTFTLALKQGVIFKILFVTLNLGVKDGAANGNVRVENFMTTDLKEGLRIILVTKVDCLKIGNGILAINLQLGSPLELSSLVLAKLQFSQHDLQTVRRRKEKLLGF